MKKGGISTFVIATAGIAVVSGTASLLLVKLSSESTQQSPYEILPALSVKSAPSAATTKPSQTPARSTTGPLEIVLPKKAEDSAAIERAQREYVISMLDAGSATDALRAAKAYFNVVRLDRTHEALDLFAKALGKARGAIAEAEFRAAFNSTQRLAVDDIGDGPAPAMLLRSKADVIALQSVTPDATPYEALIQKLTKAKRTYYSLMASGNILLLAGRPSEAKAQFLQACDLVSGKGDKIRLLRDGIEAVARATRAETCDVDEADRYVIASRTIGDPSTPNRKHDDIRNASQRVTLSSLPGSLPQTELLRQAAKDKLDVPAIKVLERGKGEPSFTVRQISSTHVSITLTHNELRSWFMFRLQGVAGRTVRVDISGGDRVKWRTLNPVFSYNANLADPNSFRAASSSSAPLLTSANGSKMPANAGGSWSYITDVWQADAGTSLSFIQHFDQDEVCVASRVPYGPALDAYFMNQYRSDARVTVHAIGKSQTGQPLEVIELGTGDRKITPCVLIYAREHPNEHDGSWVAKGAIDFLLSGDPETEAILQKTTFLFIPILDPDGADAGAYRTESTEAFTLYGDSIEVDAYAAFFKKWADQGNRLDIVFNLHCLQSAEGSHIFAPTLEPTPERLDAINLLHNQVIARVAEAGFKASATVRARNFFTYRLGGYLLGYYGPMHLLYEVNAQAPQQHLTLDDLSRMGAVLARTAADTVEWPDFRPFLGQVDAIRQRRVALTRTVPLSDKLSAKEFEYMLIRKSGLPKSELPDPNLLR